MLWLWGRRGREPWLRVRQESERSSSEEGGAAHDIQER